jgi:deoxyribose-phosphate aldolase
MTSLPPSPTSPAFENLAQIIDHSLLRPGLSVSEVVEQLELAKKLGVASVTLRPGDIDLGARTLEGSPVKAGAVCSYPYGWDNTSVKLYAVRDLIRRGAREIDTVVAASRLISREFQNVQSELTQLAETCRKEGAVLKVILEATCLTDELKIIGCRCCERAEVNFVVGHTVEDVKLLRKYLPEEIGVKAVSEISSLDHVLQVTGAGATRIGTASTVALLEEWEVRKKAESGADPQP